MIRLLAFAIHASEALTFTKGLFDTDEPDLWQKDLTGAIQLWIEVGQPDEKRLMKACGRSRAGDRVQLQRHQPYLVQADRQQARTGASNLTVINIPADASAQLEKLANRNMQLQCTIQDGQIYLTDSVDDRAGRARELPRRPLTVAACCGYNRR